MVHHFSYRSILTFTAFILLWPLTCSAQSSEIGLSYSREGLLEYMADSLGNRIPDYSYAGYHGGNKEIPDIPAVLFIPWQEEDATAVIQAAIDFLAAQEANQMGIRGAIQLDKGVFSLGGRLRITASGIVLRGWGMNRGGTTLLATGSDRETLIRVEGKHDISYHDKSCLVYDYLPVNTMQIAMDHPACFKENQDVEIRFNFNKEYIAYLGMDEFGGETDWLGWKEGRDYITWHRKILKIESGYIALDAPLPYALDPEKGKITITPFTWKGKLREVGIENISLASSYDPDNPKDEDHCWFASSFENVENSWLRQVSFNGFAGSAVAIFKGASKITVEDCISENPVSEIGGLRRNTFFTEGEQVLFQRCYAEKGYHDFSTGNFTAGPTAFVQCQSYLPFSFSGTADRLATGVLFDLLNIDGNALAMKNRYSDGQGAGWTAANSMIWQCTASKIECFSPPGEVNFAYGTWGQYLGNGNWYEANSHIKPRSLYYAQLIERLGSEARERSILLPDKFGSTSSPSIELAKELSTNSAKEALLLKDWIRKAQERNPIPLQKDGLVTFKAPSESTSLNQKQAVQISNGWMQVDGSVLTGKTLGIQWWRGSTRPHAVNNATPHITRFVPGKNGTGLTDRLEDVTSYMLQNNFLALDHHYGLWYERRRDDHVRTRRMDPDVWAPFYELPFARSGQGQAWDALSKYDLNKPNAWYWKRLQDFAKLADENGLVLIHQNYFQHNILEAGAHFADFPWRTANNINNTGFPEPPPYAGNKRIFMAEQFYDTTSLHRKELHRLYIKQCLSAFSSNSNVLQVLSEEYTGPLHFMEFWLDLIGDWSRENNQDPLVVLSATKDVQDAILTDPKREGLVDIIDIKYWQYREDFSLYAPLGGQNLAPRQHARLTEAGNPSFESVYRAVSEYRKLYPEKAVIYSGKLKSRQHWAVFMAGGSMAALPELEDPGLLRTATTMFPIMYAEGTVVYRLGNALGESIIYLEDGYETTVDLGAFNGKYKASWIDPSTGNISGKEKVLKGGKSHQLQSPLAEDALLWIRKTK